MKRLFILSAMAFFALVACEQPEPAAPELNGNEEGVETKLVLSVSTGSAETRMSAASVQKADNFLGINNARMLAFDTGFLGSDSQPTYALKTDGSGWKKTFDLGMLYSADKISGVTENQTSRSNRILKLLVPNGVNAVVFYGKAINPSPGAERGYTVCNYNDTLSKINFLVKRRIGDFTNVSKYDATARLMIAAVNFVMDSKVRALGETEYYKTYSAFPGLSACSLKEIGHVYAYRFRGDATYDHAPYHATINRELSELEQVMGEAYYAFSNIPENTYRAGCSQAIIMMINSMVSLMNANALNDASDAGSANALRLGDEIERRIKVVFTYREETFPGTDIKYIAEVTGFQDNEDILSALSLTEDTRYVGAMNLNNYPYGDFNIPEGAAQFRYTHEVINNENVQAGADEFYYLHPNDPLVNPNMESFEPRKYVYPAELMYFANSGLRTSPNEIADSAYPDGVTNWNNDAWTGFSNHGSVNADTKSIAVRDNINYGVALMETYVRWKGDNENLEMHDNRGEVLKIADGDKTFYAKDLNLYLRGILIGGINPVYDWQYLPTGKFNAILSDESNGTYGTFDGVIYDDHIVGADTIPGTGNSTTGINPIQGRHIPFAENPNYTLVYDNYNAAKVTPGETVHHQDSVYVTLEFVNMGDPFYGKNDMIPTGGTFYLVAKLEPNKAGTGTDNQFSGTWPTTYQIPPLYGIDGEAVPDGKTKGLSKQIPRVFIQNYVTKVTFRLKEDSLAKAFYSIPDLKAAQMSLALSVDLNWITGYTFDVDF